MQTIYKTKNKLALKCFKRRFTNFDNI